LVYRRDNRRLSARFYKTGYESVTDLHLLFIDFKQVYDRADKEYLYHSSKEFEVLKKFVNLEKITLTDSNCRLKFKDDNQF
jgi:hypothetical protein